MNNMPITIEQIKELMAKATPGPWRLTNVPEIKADNEWVVERGCGFGSCFSGGGNKEKDLHFIAALPDIAQLCLSQAEEIERLKLTIRGKTFTE